MKVKNAIAQLEKHIGPVEVTSCEDRAKYRAVPPGGQTGIEFSTTPWTDEIQSLRVRTEGDEDDPSTDYRAGSWFRNIKQAIEFVQAYRWPSESHED